MDSFATSAFRGTCCNRARQPSPNFLYATSSSLSVRRNLHVSAQSGRHRSRRNTFRRKLLGISQVRRSSSSLVRQNPPVLSNTDGSPKIENNSISSDLQNPHEQNKIDAFESIPGSDVRRITDKTAIRNNVVDRINVAELESILSRPRALWGKFGKISSQFWKESEFWGIGFHPIFLIFRNIEGNIEKVELDEDEIIRRCKGKSGEQADWQYKISYAKMMAKKMEDGNYILSSNTLLCKVIDSGSNAGFSLALPTIPTISVPSNMLLKCSSAGIALLCCSFILWAVIKFATISQTEPELTKMEREMLRRKMFARSEKKRMEEKVGIEVEVLPKCEAPPALPARRPKLDEQAVIRNIEVLKGIDFTPQTRSSSFSSDRDSGNLRSENKMEEVKNMENQLRNDAITIKAEKVALVKDDLSLNTSCSNVRDDIYNGVPEASDTSTRGTLDFSSPSSRVSKQSEGIPKNRNRARSSLKKAIKRKGKVILSVEEARKFLDKKHGGGSMKQEVPKKGPRQDVQIENEQMGILSGRSSKDRILQVLEEEHDLEKRDMENKKNATNTTADDSTLESEGDGSSNTSDSRDKEGDEVDSEIDSVIDKVFDGFIENYKDARERNKDGVVKNYDIEQIVSSMESEDLDWMKNDSLREIVFQVRENELAGREPFYAMDDEDRKMFFQGLKDKVQRANEDTAILHEWFHANFENMDHGLDGVDTGDSPEKFMPRWRGPPIQRHPEVDKEMEELKNLNFDLETGDISYANSTEESVSKSDEVVPSDKNAASSITNEPNVKPNDNLKDTKTLIEGSDGSLKAGKKSAKEYWQHTKKWTQGFLDVYKRTTDPEVRAALRECGKDLDRWITPEEVEASKKDFDLSREEWDFINARTRKVKGEVDRYGSQAVMGKYREYGVEKKDYFWWLDLPFVMCIELYLIEDGKPRVGLYTLEMAPDLKLNPKPFHVIAFEDPRDCENVCFIIQAYMCTSETRGRCVPAPQHPKDLFRYCKEGGYGVSVMREGYLELNADMVLSHVEEMLIAYGSEMYYDSFMNERGIDGAALINGVLFTGSDLR